MKLFSRVAFICNISFIAFILLGYIELSHKKNKVAGDISPLPFITGILVILGQLAIFINLFYCLITLGMLFAKKIQQTPRWLVIANFLFLLIQLYYFFIY
jgi:hypothetical protein